MTRPSLVPMLVLVAAISACKKSEAPPVPKVSATTTVAASAPVAAEDHPDDAIAWRRGDVDAAFAEARAANKPVFLYWGAGWCPPCNQMKATLFKRREFVERTAFFVPVYVDGDTPAAQQLGTRFSVSGYPTMVLFRPDGTEITRLPGEADPERYLQVLTLGMSARPVRATLKTALGDGRGLTEGDWRMLAWYSWDTDDQQLVPTAEVAPTLQKLAAHCPARFADTHARLTMKTAAAVGDVPTTSSAPPAPVVELDRKSALAEVEGVLAQPRTARENFDMLTNAMPEIVRATTLTATPERRRLLAEADRVLARLAADTSLSNTDRLSATTARVQLLRIDEPSSAGATFTPAFTLPRPMRDEVQAEVARADRESGNPLERQTVINAAADLLTTAGLLDESDALLKAELPRSHSPYYFMLDLASNAKKRGDQVAALDWYAKAWDAAKGPATRLQWGATYLNALVDLSPDDGVRIEKTADGILGEVEPVASSFDGRNRKSLGRLSKKVAEWGATGDHRDAAIRIAAASRKLCDRLPATAPERAQCGDLLRVGSSMAKPGPAA